MNTNEYMKKYLKTHWKQFVFFLILPQILLGIVGFLYYPLLEKIVNLLVVQHQNVIAVLICFFGVIVAHLSLKFIFNQGKAHFYIEMKADLSKKLQEKMWKVPTYILEKIPEEKFIEINKNVNLVQEYLQSRINIIIAFALFMFSAIYIVISIHFIMLIIEMVIIIMMFLLNLVSQPLERRQQQILEREEFGISIIRNICNSIDIIKQYFMESIMANKVVTASTNIGSSKLKRSDLRNIMEVLNQFVGCIIMIIIPFITALLSDISYGNIVISMLLFFFLMEQVTTIMSNLMDYNQSKIVTSFMDQILSCEEVIIPPSINEKINKLELIDKHIGYGDDKFYKIYSSTFEIGGINAVVGESGSGKSTLLKFLTGELKVEDDSVYINDRKSTISHLLPQLAYVPQHFCGISGDILYNLDLSKKGITYKRIEEYYSLIFGDSFQFWKNQNNVENFSGGQQQIVSILRGIICDREVILLDEPTSSMSNKMREKFISFIKKYAQDHLVIIVTHDYEIINNAINVIKV